MTAFAATRTLRRYIDRDKRDDVKRLKDALYEGGTTGMQSLGQIYALPDFVCEGTTDSNTAAASSPVISLSDEGVSFPANTHRDIIVETWAANGSNVWRYRTRQRVLGGTDPTLKGPQEFETECTAYYGFTTADGTTTTEDATSCIAPAWWDGASPVAGSVASNTATIQWLGTNSPVSNIIPGFVNNLDAAAAAADARSYQHGNVSLTNGTTTCLSRTWRPRRLPTGATARSCASRRASSRSSRARSSSTRPRLRMRFGSARSASPAMS
jgi:hypothetical protein